MDIGYYNGSFAPAGEIRIPLTDRAVFFGDGIYEVILARNKNAYLLDAHLDRFYKNVATLGIEFDKTREELTDIIKIALSGFEGESDGTSLVYFQVSKSSKRRIHATPRGSGSNLLLTVSDTEMPCPKKTAALITYPDLRYMYCNIKTLNLLPAVIASEYAERNGADEAVLCRKNTVTECAHSNVFIIKDGILYTHPDCELILPGITKLRLFELCRRLSIPFREEAFTQDALYAADCVLISSSTKLLRIARSVDSFVYDEKRWALGRLLCEELYNDFMESTD